MAFTILPCLSPGPILGCLLHCLALVDTCRLLARRLLEDPAKLVRRLIPHTASRPICTGYVGAAESPCIILQFFAIFSLV
ncbi:uncharacterized protein BO96DRAFT_50174 [Aspergillus niger CBS 101883]|uniref:uncharacterized protein n=1 Tax=Aspergillus lacticoffeatus (strain CBS 101883) TaxID=1450533 RepID=UPI000D7F6DC0|nr:uncharacterized protein BO96DRAFT_50174 [Aspergillus niger CBS 101883]PYH56678.1 hypothetical protein BO96DRAFT_50174 [Aspergillus niger CBS 101883]